MTAELSSVDEERPVLGVPVVGSHVGRAQRGKAWQCGWSSVSRWVNRWDIMRDRGWGQVLYSSGREFGFVSECNGKPLECLSRETM